MEVSESLPGIDNSSILTPVFFGIWYYTKLWTLDGDGLGDDAYGIWLVRVCQPSIFHEAMISHGFKMSIVILIYSDHWISLAIGNHWFMNLLNKLKNKYMWYGSWTTDYQLFYIYIYGNHWFMNLPWYIEIPWHHDHGILALVPASLAQRWELKGT